MRLFDKFRATEVAEDPAVAARLNGIAARTKAEGSLYQAIKQAQRSHRPAPASKGFKKAPE